MVTLLLGSAGSGKTALLADYARGPGMRMSYISLAASDRDPIVWFSRLCAALRDVIPEAGAAARSYVDSLGPAGVAGAAALICDALNDRGLADLVVILDGIGHLGADDVTREGLAVLLRSFPEDGQLILAGRTVPPLRLAKLRLENAVVELDESALWFDRSEVEALAGDSVAAERVWSRTHGWPAGTVFALEGATAGQGALDRAELLYEYLNEEFLSDFPADFRRDLERASFLPPRDEAGGRGLLPGRWEMFRERVAATPALVARGEGIPPLVRECLQREVRQRWPAADRVDLFRALAENPSFGPEAQIDFLIEAGDALEAARRLVACSQTLFASGLVETLRGLLGRLEGLGPSSPFRTYLLGELARREGRLAEGHTHLVEARQALEAQGPLRDPELRLHRLVLAATAAVHAARGEVDLQESVARLALDGLPAGSDDIAALGLNVLGAAHIARVELDAAEACFSQALARFGSAGDSAGQVRVLHNMGLVAARRGDFRRAVGYYDESVRSAIAAGRLPLPMTYNNLALCHHYLGASSDCQEALAEGMALAKRTGARRDALYLVWTLGMVHMKHGDLDRAMAFFDDSLADATRSGDSLSQANACLGIAECQIEKGDPVSAQVAVDRACATLGAAIEDPRMREAATAQVAVWLKSGRLAKARALLDRIAEDVAGEEDSFRSFLFANLRRDLAIAEGDSVEEERQGARSEELAGAFGYAQLGRRRREVSGKARDAGTSDSGVVLEVRALGAFEIRLGGRVLDPGSLKSANAKVLLAYLLLNPEGLSRERLVDLLYPGRDSTPSAFHMVLSRLRQALEPDAKKGAPSRFVLFADDRYAFNPGISSRIDVHAFRAGLRSARAGARSEERSAALDAALPLYRGGFLQDLPDLPWSAIEGESLRRGLVEGHEARFALAAAADDWSGLESLAERLLALEPASQPAHRAKMAAQVMLNRPNDALNTAALARKLLATVAGMDPDEETLDLEAAIRSGEVTVRRIRESLISPWD